jgi:uncharacterized membrane-anchored protein
MKKYKWIILLANLILLLVFVNYSLVSNEKLLRDGKLILLELAPVDPRSLLQGDYMQLRYEISANPDYSKYPKRGFCVVLLDSNGVAHRVRFQQSLRPLGEEEYLIKYTAPSEWNIQIGAESYFFQKGQSQKFQQAKYGGLKIDVKGNSLLYGLYNNRRQKIE